VNRTEFLRALGSACKDLEEELNSQTPEDFIKQFRHICSCETARTLRGILYIWWCRDPIPRLKGSSNIVYIGMTTQSFRGRHYRYAEKEGSGDNWKRYKHIIEKFGPIKVSCARVPSPREAEERLLDRYFREHLELPPVNASL
jgi:hypothetical protein